MDGWRPPSNERVDAIMFGSSDEKPPKRSSGALKQRRVPLPWPEDRDFRILSIDGGGIRGIYPASFLAGLEERFLGGASIAPYFDLIAGTSTGGILALGLASGLTAAELRDLYIERGCEIFPPTRKDPIGTARRWFWSFYKYFSYRYDRTALMRVLSDTFGNQRFGEAQNRLCIPSFDGRYGEVYVFKTPHHPDYRNDAKEKMTQVGAATSAAPTFFRPLEDSGYTFIDGGVWANNPVMVALVDALSCFTVPRESIRILSLGCGDEPYTVGKMKTRVGGMLAWKDIFYGAMRLQSLDALGKAGLLIGADKIVRVNAPTSEKKIELDDWSRAVEELPGDADSALGEFGDAVGSIFLQELAAPYQPI